MLFEPATAIPPTLLFVGTLIPIGFVVLVILIIVLLVKNLFKIAAIIGIILLVLFLLWLVPRFLSWSVPGLL